MHDRCWFSALAVAFVLCVTLAGRPLANGTEEGRFGTAQAVVHELYRLVTFDAGTTPDWDRVRALFIDQAVIVLRTSRTETSVFSVDGFVEDFVTFINRSNVEETGFGERIIRTKPFVFGDIAHVLVLYEAHIPGSVRGPQQGVDSFHLIRKDGRWWIASVVNEIPAADRPMPAELRE
jgi:hypothetical protein